MLSFFFLGGPLGERQALRGRGPIESGPALGRGVVLSRGGVCDSRPSSSSGGTGAIRRRAGSPSTRRSCSTRRARSPSTSQTRRQSERARLADHPPSAAPAPQLGRSTRALALCRKPVRRNRSRQGGAPASLARAAARTAPRRHALLSRCVSIPLSVLVPATAIDQTRWSYSR